MDSEILRGKPFYLSDEDVKWAEETFSSMTTEEKIGQLFFLIVYGPDAETIDKIAKEIGAGGAMCRAMPTENVVATVSALQKKSKIPMLISANLEAGGNGISDQGTKVGSQMMIAAAGGTHGEPGHGLTGTTPYHAGHPDAEERPGYLYVSEVSHNLGDKAYCYGGGHYRRGHMKNALVGTTPENAKVVPVLPPDDLSLIHI